MASRCAGSCCSPHLPEPPETTFQIVAQGLKCRNALTCCPLIQPVEHLHSLSGCLLGDCFQSYSYVLNAIYEKPDIVGFAWHITILIGSGGYRHHRHTLPSGLNLKRLHSRPFFEFPYVSFIAPMIAADSRLRNLSNVTREALERWFSQQTRARMGARTRTLHRSSLVAFCKWCVETSRMVVNPLNAVAKADEKVDRRREGPGAHNHGRGHDDHLDLQQKILVRTAVERFLQPCERLVYDFFSVGVLPYRTHSTTGPRRSEVP
jgi:hypothetical protein